MLLQFLQLLLEMLDICKDACHAEVVLFNVLVFNLQNRKAKNMRYAEQPHTVYRRLLICCGLGSTSLRRSTFQALSLSTSRVSRFLSFSRRLSWLTASFSITGSPPVNSYTEETGKIGDADNEDEDIG